jgi:2-polyprenyl-3-methyl-5-hydroxy-6-metoxy-1,4-benzoquinol methylase
MNEKVGESSMSLDKAGKAYWDHNWENREIPTAVDPRAKSLNNYADRKFHEYFRTAFSSVDTSNQKLLEIGCARSAWLPYFAKEFGFIVHGIDYSEIGCRQAAQVLENEGVVGDIVCTDFFSPPEHMLGDFDVVWSRGVLEHFEDTAACATAFSKFLRPGGLMITIIPNLSGVIGIIQRIINRPVFNMHVTLDRSALEEAHRSSGLEGISCAYFLFASLLLNIENLRSTPFYNVAIRLISWSTKAMWMAERTIPLLRPNRWTSPYIVCVARKPCA